MVSARTTRPVAALVVMVVVLLGAGVAALWVGGPDTAYAARWAGTSGQFTAGSCAEVGSGKGRHTECVGVFRPDGGVGTVARVAQQLAPGDVVPMQRTVDGGYVRAGVSSAFGWAAVTLLGVALATTALMTVVSFAGFIGLRRGWWVPVFGVAGALCCALVAVVARLLG